YDIKNAQAFNKKEITDPSQVGVRAKDDWTLEVTLEGPRGYFPVLAAFLAALPAHRASVEKHADKWTEAANIVCNGPFVLETWQHGKGMVLRKNKHFFGAKDVTLDSVTTLSIPAHAMIPPGFPGALDDPKVKAIQHFDPKLAMAQLRGTPFEGGKNWPKITLTMRDEALGSKPLAEAVQSVLLEHLNMRTDLEVLEPRVFRERLWKQDLQFVWI